MRTQCVLIVVAMAMCLVQASHAVTIVTNSNIQLSASSEFPPANYRARVYQDLAGDYTHAWFQVSGNASSGFSFGLTTYNLDEGADWYWVSEGDVLSEQTIDDGVWRDQLLEYGPTLRPVESEFYIGVRTGNFYSGPDQRDVFGWVRFRITPRFSFPEGWSGELTMVENVLAYDSIGIIIGTTQTVPEPSLVAIASISLAGLICISRRFRPLPAPA